MMIWKYFALKVRLLWLFVLWNWANVVRQKLTDNLITYTRWKVISWYIIFIIELSCSQDNVNTSREMKYLKSKLHDNVLMSTFVLSIQLQSLSWPICDYFTSSCYVFPRGYLCFPLTKGGMLKAAHSWAFCWELCWLFIILRFIC